ncbi:hypothetical protein NPX13_g24 [Xylaria arbuscula]|uniref:Uncharacterized protein n=1 Tax=Xylaria arbuscula TaxID=114810 RepID=A0A9W8TRF4_9PEZI|nr:hypothetical protein NPX13_g24 [Xylaria arbuscula]
MDWLRSDDTLWEKNLTWMEFEPAKSTVLLLSKSGNVSQYGFSPSDSMVSLRSEKAELSAREYTVQSDQDWEAWLDQASLTVNRGLGARADTGGPDPGVLLYLPFSESTFRRLIRTFKIHGTIARTISRNTSCAFIRKFHSGSFPDEKSIVYNCRSSASWDEDLSLSVTFSLRTLTTHAVIYGCNSRITEEITNRLSTSDVSSLHPMLLVVLFAEIERNRLDRLVRDKISKLFQQIVNISTKRDVSTLENQDFSSQSLSLAMSIRDWLQMGERRNELQTFKRKMCDMMEHLDEFQEKYLNLEKNEENFAASLDADTLSGLRETGMRMKERLKHLVDEFDELIGKCTTMIDGVGPASQLEWNQIGRRDTMTNLAISQNGLEVAQHTRRDSELMKSIALLTMVFLPATFVATLFSMGIFQWNGSHGENLNVSPYIWLYVVVTVVITSATLGAWYIWVIRRDAPDNSQSVEKDVEAQRTGQSEKVMMSPASSNSTRT